MSQFTTVHICGKPFSSCDETCCEQYLADTASDTGDTPGCLYMCLYMCPLKWSETQYNRHWEFQTVLFCSYCSSTSWLKLQHGRNACYWHICFYDSATSWCLKKFWFNRWNYLSGYCSWWWWGILITSWLFYKIRLQLIYHMLHFHSLSASVFFRRT